MAIFIELFHGESGCPWMHLQCRSAKDSGMRKVNKKQALVIGLFFGGFQALMPLMFDGFRKSV